MRTLLILAGITVAAAVGGGLWLFDALERLQTEPLLADTEPQAISVSPGTPFAAVARRLESDGYVDNAELLRLYARFYRQAARIKAGEYRIEPGMTAPELLQAMVDGDVIRHRLTVVEGWTFRQLLAAVADHPALEHQLQGLDAAAIMERLGHPGEHPEGRFLPETYRFPQGTTDVAFLRRAYEAMSRKLQRAWAQRQQGLPLDTPYEALILASIVEKETAVAAERSRIAGVFVRRLERGMRLQTDPTVIYGLGETYDGDIRYRDLRGDTPYNTYIRRGLPPTPIALPGAEAIEAALHPAPGEALYFVSRGDGSHHFSATLAEHNRAVREYQTGVNRRQ